MRLGPDDLAVALRADVVAGLTAVPRSLPPKWFYDERGGQLFDDITRLPEYYPTRAETEILASRAAEVAAVTGATHLVELGSGTSTKTRLLLDALAVSRFTPFDVDEAMLRAAGPAVEAAYPGLEVHGVVGDFQHHLGALPGAGGRLVAFLGSTIGNLEPPDRGKLLAELASTLHGGEWLLLGTDLVKDEATLVAAYDDAAGVTAEFNRNVLRVLNRQLGADFDVDAFHHRAVWVPEDEWIEMRLVAGGEQRVGIPAVDLAVTFADGEEVRTEISAKFRRPGVEGELAAVGLEVVRWWTDAAGRFALSLSRRS
ncbi:MAG: L-histidine N(alpha)-methyltransferase [Acidimicrobiales bacterium]